MLKQDHIAAEEMLEYAEGRLESPAAARIRGHLETGCERCVRELAFWQRSLAALEADRQPGAPDWVIRRAIMLGDRLEAQQRQVHAAYAGRGRQVAQDRGQRMLRCHLVVAEGHAHP